MASETLSSKEKKLFESYIGSVKGTTCGGHSAPTVLKHLIKKHNGNEGKLSDAIALWLTGNLNVDDLSTWSKAPSTKTRGKSSHKHSQGGSYRRDDHQRSSRPGPRRQDGPAGVRKPGMGRGSGSAQAPAPAAAAGRASGRAAGRGRSTQRAQVRPNMAAASKAASTPAPAPAPRAAVRAGSAWSKPLAATLKEKEAQEQAQLAARKAQQAAKLEREEQARKEAAKAAKAAAPSAQDTQQALGSRAPSKQQQQQQQQRQQSGKKPKKNAPPSMAEMLAGKKQWELSAADKAKAAKEAADKEAAAAAEAARVKAEEAAAAAQAEVEAEAEAKAAQARAEEEAAALARQQAADAAAQAKARKEAAEKEAAAAAAAEAARVKAEQEAAAAQAQAEAEAAQAAMSNPWLTQSSHGSSTPQQALNFGRIGSMASPDQISFGGVEVPQPTVQEETKAEPVPAPAPEPTPAAMPAQGLQRASDVESALAARAHGGMPQPVEAQAPAAPTTSQMAPPPGMVMDQVPAATQQYPPHMGMHMPGYPQQMPFGQPEALSQAMAHQGGMSLVHMQQPQAQAQPQALGGDPTKGVQGMQQSVPQQGMGMGMGMAPPATAGFPPASFPAVDPSMMTYNPSLMFNHGFYPGAFSHPAYPAPSFQQGMYPGGVMPSGQFPRQGVQMPQGTAPQMAPVSQQLPQQGMPQQQMPQQGMPQQGMPFATYGGLGSMPQHMYSTGSAPFAHDMGMQSSMPTTGPQEGMWGTSNPAPRMG